jgi:hypothetical protein
MVSQTATPEPMVSQTAKPEPMSSQTATPESPESLPPEAIASLPPRKNLSPFPELGSVPSNRETETLKRAPKVPDVGADLIASQQVVKGGSMLTAIKDHTASLKALLKVRSVNK